MLVASVCGNWQAPPAVGYSQLVVGNFEHLPFMGDTVPKISFLALFYYIIRARKGLKLAVWRRKTSICHYKVSGSLNCHSKFDTFDSSAFKNTHIHTIVDWIVQTMRCKIHAVHRKEAVLPRWASRCGVTSGTHELLNRKQVYFLWRNVTSHL